MGSHLSRMSSIARPMDSVRREVARVTSAWGEKERRSKLKSSRVSRAR